VVEVFANHVKRSCADVMAHVTDAADQLAEVPVRPRVRVVEEVVSG
jgi:hypothetical protein